MRYTIKDVAKAAGVSTATVSLVMNGKDASISAKTRNLVKKTVKQLNYRPNQLAVGLATNHSKSIGLIVPDISNPFFSELAKHFEGSAKKEGYTVLVSSTGDDYMQTKNSLLFFADHQVDGIILAQADFRLELETSQVLKTIKEIQIPIVLVDRVIEGAPFPAVLVNQRHTGYLATMHLLQHGHRRIGCITGPLGIHSARQRLRGYKEALAEFNIDYNPDLVYEGDYSIQTGASAVPMLLGQKVTAVLCCSDTLAFGVYREVRNLHRAIPKDLSIVSVDNTVLADVIQPALTSVSQPIAELTVQALSTLIALINSSCQPQTLITTLQPRLMVRASVGYAPQY